MDMFSSKTPVVTAPSFITSPHSKKVRDLINSASLDGESIIKITRQLEFFHTHTSTTEEEMITLTTRLFSMVEHRASDSTPKFQVPKVRFGKTELQMPIITCGGMQLQQTWLPDNIPFLSPKKHKVVKGKSQVNLKECIRTCLKLGINHFETARMYGTSELQFVVALSEMIAAGEVEREDVIFQTKIIAKFVFGKTFPQNWEHTWNHCKALGYIDLFSFHIISSDWDVEAALSEGEDSAMAFVNRLKEEGKIRHLGFSTHGTAGNIMKCIESGKFEYVNLHCHYFGDYHAEGTMANEEEQGNKACVRRALELDMGVFGISPNDKGGFLYKPSRDMALAIGSDMTPIAFGALHCWRTMGMHTITLGIARVSDLDESLTAADLFANGKFEEYDAAYRRLDDIFIEKLGVEWRQKGMINLPTCYEECSGGMAIGHMLWLHNKMTAFGMYDVCKARYKMLEETVWKADKSFEENAKAMSSGNGGRSYDPNVDLSNALKGHYNPALVEQKLKECHSWLNKDVSFSQEERVEKGWDMAYSLTPWEQFPGGELTPSGVFLQNLTGGLVGAGGGPDKKFDKEVELIRSYYKK